MVGYEKSSIEDRLFQIVETGGNFKLKLKKPRKNSKIVFGDCSVFYSDLLKEIPQLRYSHEMCPSVVFFSKPSEYIPQL